MRKSRVVLDTSVVVAGIGWRGESRRVLRVLATHAFESARTPYLTHEWAESAQRIASKPNPNWVNWVGWLKSASELHPEIPIRKTAQDPKDDPILMAAVSARAQFIVTLDKDLLVLENPYGIACVTPRAFLSAILKTG